MASKFGADVTGLSEPDPRSAQFIQRGVTDTSSAQMIESLGGMIRGQIEQYETSKLTSEVDEAIKGYFADPIMEQNVGMLAEQTEGLISPEEDEALTDASKRLAQVRSAYNTAGTGISEIELKARVESITKSYINRFPGLSQQFRTIAANELGDYAVRIKQIEAAKQPQQNAMLEWAQKEYIKKGGDPFSEQFPEWFPKLLKMNNDEQVTTAAKNLRDRAVVNREMILSDPEAWIPVTRSTTREYMLQANAIMSNPEWDVKRRISELERITATTLSDISSWNPAGTSDPKVTNFMESIKTMKVSFQGMMDGSLSAEEVTNKVTAYQKAIEFGMLNDPSLSGLIIANKLFPDLMVTLIQSGTDMRPFVNGIQRVIQGDYPFAANYLPADARTRDKEVTQFFGQLKKAMGISVDTTKGITTDDVKIVNDSLYSLMDGIHKEKSSAAYDGLVDTLADENFIKYQNKYMPADLSSRLSGPVNTFITDSVLTAFNGSFDASTMRLTATEDGRMLVNAIKDDMDTRRKVDIINRDYMPRFSKYVKVSSHLQGSTNYGEAAKNLAIILGEVSKGVKETQETNPRKINILLPAPRGREDEYIVVSDLISRYTVEPIGAWIKNLWAVSGMIGQEIIDLPAKVRYGPSGKPKEVNE